MQTSFLIRDGVRLRGVEPSDGELMWKAESDSSQWTENGMAGPFSKFNLENYATTYDPDPFRAGQLRLIVEHDGITVGIADLYEVDGCNRTAFVGIYIFPEFRRKGYGTEALELLSDYSARLLNLHILAAKVSGDNTGSVSLFEKVGFKIAGEIPGWFLSGYRASSLLYFYRPLMDNQVPV